MCEKQLMPLVQAIQNAGAATGCALYSVTALLHHITIDLLKRSYHSLERDSAPRGSSSSSPASFRQSELYTRCPVTASTPEPEGGARCVSSARRDLCGGARRNPRPYRDHGPR